MKPNNKRIGYIDALRGFTMLLVVCTHVELFCFGIEVRESLIGNLFITFRMPMFFFISGYIAYKSVMWDNTYYKKMVKKKSMVQIIPTLFFYYLYYCVCNGRRATILYTHGPMSFWFTITLFYMFMIYYAVMFLTRNIREGIADIILIVIAFLGALIYIGGMKFYNLQSFPLLCLTNLSRYFEFFVLGVLCRKYREAFLRIISHDYVKTFLILTFLGVFIISWKETIIRYSLIHVFNLEFTLRYLGLFLVFAIFFHYKDVFEKENVITKNLRFIGQRTLDIYLLHYFLLPDLKLYKEMIFSGVAPQNSILELTVVMVISLLIIAFCILLSNIIRSSSILGHYLLGAKLPEK